MVMIMDRENFVNNVISSKKIEFEELILKKKIKFEPLILKKKFLDSEFLLNAHIIKGESDGESIEVLYGTPENPISLHDERFTQGESRMYFICGCISDFPEDNMTMIGLDVANNEEAVYKLTVQVMDVNKPTYLITLDASDYLNAMGAQEFDSFFYDIYYQENETNWTWQGWTSLTYGSFAKALIGNEDASVDLLQLNFPYLYRITGYLQKMPKAFEDSGYARGNKLLGYLYVFNEDSSQYPTVYILGDKIFVKKGGNSLDNIKEFKPLPDVSVEDNGKVLVVENGEWVAKKMN